ncbi:MAG TPA: hypothetical protein VJY62_16280, partial [Bacteroidia bacterium]|nr:hypothetical protein [Bacteroidia bacterium]
GGLHHTRRSKFCPVKKTAAESTSLSLAARDAIISKSCTVLSKQRSLTFKLLKEKDISFEADLMASSSSSINATEMFAKLMEQQTQMTEVVY